MISLENRLPFDGEVYYLKNIFSKIKSEEYFNALLKEIKWENDQVMMFGKTIVTKREVAWAGSQHCQAYALCPRLSLTKSPSRIYRCT